MIDKRIGLEDVGCGVQVLEWSIRNMVTIISLLLFIKNQNITCSM